MSLEYVQVSAPNEEKLKELINGIKGTRNMSTFTDVIKQTTSDMYVHYDSTIAYYTWEITKENLM